MQALSHLFTVAALLMASLHSAGIALANDEQFQIFVSPSGDDGAAGTAVAKPVKTLSKALSLYETSCASRATRIVLSGGTYGSEKNALKKASCPLRIETAGAERPRFEGKGEGTWLSLSIPGVKQVDITISGIEISNYQTAISINGNRNDPQGWIGGIKILKNRFVKIGSFRNDQKPSTAAVRLVNARSVLIEGNEFETIRNAQHCGGLHSIYIAHMSSDNRIVGNSFLDGCGFTIKVRDSSNRNIVENNRFEKQTRSALFLDSYCDRSTGVKCTKRETECPSWDNLFRDNVIVGPRAPIKRVQYTLSAAPTLPGNCLIHKGSTDRIREERTSVR